MTALLLDTGVAVSAAEDELSEEGRAAIDRAFRAGADLWLSPITAWEIGLLMSKGLIASPLAPADWFARLAAVEGLKVAELTPAILVAASYLPPTAPRDPADRILVATARALGVPLLTQDRLLVGYAQAGHVHAVAC